MERDDHEKTEDTAPAELQPSDAETDDAFGEFKAAVGGITRLKMRVKPDVQGQSRGIIMMIMLIIVAGAVFLGFSKNRIATIVIAAIVVAVAVAAIVVMALVKASARKVYYCYYIRDERGVFCMSVIDDSVTVFDGETAYRIEGDNMYTLPPEAYAEWLDGEGTGLYFAQSIKDRDDRFEYTGASYVIKSKEGGSHEYFFEDGKPTRIVSCQPCKTDEVDEKTGKAKVKIKEFEKVDPTDDFVLEVPDFVKQSLAMYDIDWREG